MPAIRSAVDLTRFPPYASTNFREFGQGEVRRILLPHASVNKFLRGMTTLRKLAQALEVDPAEPVRGE